MQIVEDELEKMRQKICEANKAPVLFVGTGLSIRYYGIPNWKELLYEVAEKVGLRRMEIDQWGGNEKIATLLEEICNKNNKNLRGIICKIISKKQFSDDKWREEKNMLSRISPHAIVTTNYDQVLETIFGNRCQVCVGQDFKNEETGDWNIYKIHGSVTEPDSIVITEKDYENFMENSKYLYAKLLTMFWEYPIIFIGYSITDSNVKDILKNMIGCMSKRQKVEFLQRVWIVDYKPKGESEEVLEKNISLDNGTLIKVKTFYLNASYKELYRAVYQASDEVFRKNLKFVISENAINLFIKPLYQQQNKFKVVVRELLQNAIDACKMRKNELPIEVHFEFVVGQDEKCIMRVSDNGVGMSWKDIQDYFLTIGKSNKKGDENQEKVHGLTGQFGIGVLSLFLISKNITVYSKKEDEAPVALRLTWEDGGKKVESIEKKNGVDKIEKSGTIIELQIEDEGTLERFNKAKTAETVMEICGLKNYCVWEQSDITVALLKEKDGQQPAVPENCSNSAKIPCFEKEDMITIKDEELYLARRYGSGEFSCGKALINDMMVSIALKCETGRIIKSSDIPFFALRTREGEYEGDIEAELSRDKVLVKGQLVEDILKQIYIQEIEHLFQLLRRLEGQGNVPITKLWGEIDSHCELLKDWHLPYKNGKVLFFDNMKPGSTPIVYGQKELFETMSKKEECALDSQQLLNRADVGRLIERNCLLGIGMEYLERYIINATNSYNGLKMSAVEKFFEKTGVVKKFFHNAAEMWTYIEQNKEDIRSTLQKNVRNGLLWLKEEYKNQYPETGDQFQNAVVAFPFPEWENDKLKALDKKFVELLKAELEKQEDNSVLKKYIEIVH